MEPTLRTAIAEISANPLSYPVGRVASVRDGRISVAGLPNETGLGHILQKAGDRSAVAEVVSVSGGEVTAVSGFASAGLTCGTPFLDLGPACLWPHECWVGRVIDPFGHPLDHRPLPRGDVSRSLQRRPPSASRRRGLGARLETGLSVFNTVLPLARGQRLGLFAGTGVGKSTLLGALAQNMEADLVVIALCGERGREVRDFTNQILGSKGLSRSIVVAATSDMAPLHRRMCGASAMTIAEYFRDKGLHVLLLFDSVTRFADAHREIALSAGEPGTLAGYPASMASLVPSLCERAGTGVGAQGDITAVFSVLVAGGDMENPVADCLRGVLDGHVVLDRSIAERGRFPAVDVLKSVSRSLPDAASDAENAIIARARSLLGAHAKVEIMLRSGLYEAGHDDLTDRAVQKWGALDAFFGRPETRTTIESFEALSAILSEEGQV